LEYFSIVLNCIFSSDDCKLKPIQRQFVSLGYRRFSSHLQYIRGYVLNYLKLHTLNARRFFLDVLIFNECSHLFKIFSYPFGNWWLTRTRL
jgi:hypothetical protein